MADDPKSENAGEDAVESSAPAPARSAPRPSPAASAASRARRIGGATRSTAAAPPTEATEPTEAGPADSAPADSTEDSATARTSLIKRTSLLKRRGKKDSAPSAVAELPGADAEERADGAGGPADDVDEPADTAGDRPEVPAWLTWAPAGILIAGAVAMAVIVSIVSHGVWWGTDTASQRSVTALRQQVTAAAKTCLAATNSYKYTDIDAFEKAGSACTTGTQTTQFRKAVDTLIRKNAPKLKFSQTAQINKAAIESVSGKQWTILLYGQLAVTNVKQPSGRTDPFAAIVRMEKVGGKWLISSLRTVSSPVN